MKLLKDTAAYSILPFIQKSIGFLLLPVYTSLLTPSDYGIVGAVTSLSTLLAMLYPLGLDAALQRSNFGLLDPSITRERIWGSIMCFVVCFAAVVTLVLFASHRFTVDWATGDVSFWPYVVIGLLGAALGPIRALFNLSVQIRRMSRFYFFWEVANIFARVAALLTLIVAFRMGAQGMLLGGVIVDLCGAVVALFLMREIITFRIDWGILRQLLPYSLPVIPHMLAGWATGTLAGIALNAISGTTDAGLYFLAANLGFIQNSIVGGFGTAFLPVLYAELSRKDRDDAKISSQALAACCMFALTAAGLAAFSPEVLALMTRPAYWGAAQYVGPLALAGFFQGVYSLYANLLYFEKKGTKFLPLASGAGAIVSTAIVFLAIPSIGAWGAAAAVLGGGAVRTLVAAIAVNWNFQVPWPQGRLVVVCLLTSAVTICFSLVPAFQLVSLGGIACKVAVLLGLAICLAATLGRHAIASSVKAFRRN